MVDTWDGGADYENYMGRWSRLIAERFVAWLAIAPGSSWVDVGCGTGALTAAIALHAAPGRLAGVDPSPQFIAAARRRLGEAADLRVGDAQALPFDSSDLNAAVSGIALNFVPDPGLAVAEMRRVTKTGGTVAAYLWDYADGMQLIRTFWDVAVRLDPTIADLDEATRFPLCREGNLTALFHRSGLRRVEAVPLEISTRFEGFDEYWRPFLSGQGPAPSYVASMSQADRGRLASRLEAALPTSPDGAISLTARAWAVKAVV